MPLIATGLTLLLWTVQDLSPGYVHFHNLDFPQALAEFEKEAAADPANPNAYNHIAHAILYSEMYRNGALESELVSGANSFLRREGLNPSPEDQRRFFDAITKAVTICEQRIKRDERDTEAWYSLGVAHALRANYDFLVRKAWSEALSSAGKARKAHERVTELDPEFIDALLVQGVHQYVVGSLPRTLRFLGFLVGFRGDRAKGIEMLKRVEIYGKRNRIEAQVLLAAIYRRERRPAEAIPLLSTLGDRFLRNYLLRFELARMYADLGDKDRALEVLDRIEKDRAAKRNGIDRVPAERVAYERGNLLFWYRDYADALSALRAATAGASKLSLATGVLAWMRLGQVHDMRGERKEAVEAYSRCEAFAPRSETAKECKSYKGHAFKRSDQ